MNKICFKSAIAFVGLSAAWGITEASSAYADDAIDNVSIYVPTSCTIRATGNTSHNAEINNGTYTADIGSTNIKAVCNDNSGFAIYAAGYTGDTIEGTNSTKLIGSSTNSFIATGTATGTNTNDPSNWAMKLSTTTNPTPTYPLIIAGSPADSNKQSGDPDFSNYTSIPSGYTKVAYRASGTDTGTNATGAEIDTTYAAFINISQPADIYTGKVIYTLVHPSAEVPAVVQACASGYVCYYPNSNLTEGTMGRQSITASDTSITLIASNYSRTGYGFAGWSDSYDYATNPNAKIYGPQEEIFFTAGQYTGNNAGLSLYAVWVESTGILQGWNGCNNLTPVLFTKNANDESDWTITANLDSNVTALTDERDGDTYAVARLSDGRCWMIENLRLSNIRNSDNTPATLTIRNTNNPLNDGTTVTLKHNYTDTITYDTLSPTSSAEYNADTSPEGWCTSNSANCNNQSRVRTSNTTARATFSNTSNMTNNNYLYSYGNYYNWYSSTAGHGIAGKTSGSTEGDICPFGWHLPTGTGSGDFGLLSNSLGGYNINDVAQSMDETTIPSSVIMTARMISFPNNYIRAGYIQGSSIPRRGTGGHYWSSTAYSSSYAYRTVVGVSNVYLGTEGMSKNYGRSVRCVINSQ